MQGELYVFLACALRCGACDLASPQGAGSEDAIWVQKACRIAMAFFLILRGLYTLEMESILEMDAVNGIREPKQGRRLSDPDIDARLAHCDTANLLFGFRFRALGAGSGELENRVPRQEKTRPPFTLKNILFHYFFTRK
jgi:hypothetical protein